MTWHHTLDSVPSHLPSLYIAHEFLDALPVHQFVHDPQRGWLEKMVDSSLGHDGRGSSRHGVDIAGRLEGGSSSRGEGGGMLLPPAMIAGSSSGAGPAEGGLLPPAPASGAGAARRAGAGGVSGMPAVAAAAAAVAGDVVGDVASIRAMEGREEPGSTRYIP